MRQLRAADARAGRALGKDWRRGRGRDCVAGRGGRASEGRGRVSGAVVSCWRISISPRDRIGRGVSSPGLSFWWSLGEGSQVEKSHPEKGQHPGCPASAVLPRSPAPLPALPASILGPHAPQQPSPFRPESPCCTPLCDLPWRWRPSGPSPLGPPRRSCAFSSNPDPLPGLGPTGLCRFGNARLVSAFGGTST